MGTKATRAFVVLTLTGVVCAYQACSQQAGFARPAAGSSKMGEFPGTDYLDDGKNRSLPSNGGTTTDNPKPTLDVVMAGYDEQSAPVQDVQMCVGKIRFYRATASFSNAFSSFADSLTSQILSRFGINSGNYVQQDLDGQAVQISPGGTVIKNLSIPAGTYAQVDIELEDDCSFGSLTFINGKGRRVTSDDDETLVFTGSITIHPGDPRVLLNLQPLMSALSRADDEDDVEDILAQYDGYFLFD